MIFKELSPNWNRFALTLFFAILMSLAFPPLQLGFLAYWALVPLFFLLEDLTTRQALKWGYLAGLFWHLGTLYWIAWVTLPGLIGVLLILPLYLMVYAWAHVFLKERFGMRYLYIIPFVWVAIEYLQSLGTLGFPWSLLAYTQTYYTDLIQYVTVTGAYGVSLWVFFINVIIFILIRTRPQLRQALIWLAILIALFIIPFIYGKLVIPSEEDFEEEIRVALIQGNVDPYVKWDASFLDQNFEIYDSLTLSIADQRPDLVVWPETATACYLRSRPEYLSRVFEIARQVGAPILTGTPDYEYLDENRYNTYNGLMLIQPGYNALQVYWKMHLVPFGERVPFEDTVPFLQNFLESLNMGIGDFSEGKKYKIFIMRRKNEPLRFAGVICYESVFPDLVRRFIKLGGRFLVIVTNDAWFGNTSGPYQHAQIAVFRAVENRVSIARCANTGISSFIDPYGRILKKSRFNQQAALVQDIPLRRETTFYTQHGDLFSYVVLGISGLALMGAAAKKKA